MWPVVVWSLILCVVLQTWIHVLVLAFSAASYFGFVLLFSLFCVTCSPPTNPLGVETLQMSQPLFYIICTLTTVMALLPRYTHTHTHTYYTMYFHTRHIFFNPNSHFPAWCPLQAVGPSPARHLEPSHRSENGSDGQSWFREVLQKNAPLEPESLQSQQAASVCWQPWPGAQYRHSGFLTSFYRNTHTCRGRGLQTRQSRITVSPGRERPGSSEIPWMLRCWIQCMLQIVWILCTHVPLTSWPVSGCGQ